MRYWGFMLGMLLPFATVKSNETVVTETEETSRQTILKDTIGQPQPTAKKKKGSLIYRFFKSFDDYDTRYITPNYYNYTTMLQSSSIYEVYRLRGTDAQGAKQSLTFTSNPSLKVGPYIGWRWLFLGYQFDIGNPNSSRKKTEFDLSLYSSMLGCDLIYQKNQGDFHLSNIKGFEGVDTKPLKDQKFGGMKTYVASANVYYIFNHKHFSYPAAFSQSTVQRKSCGSWKLGLSVTHQKINFDHTQLPSLLLGPGGSLLSDDLKFKRIVYYDYSFSVGYAYNWVFARNCLFNLSLAPAIGYKHSKGVYTNGAELPFSASDLTFDVIARTGIVWNNTKWFGGASLILHTYDYRKDRFSITNSLGYLKVYFGMNFMRKRQYKHINQQ